MIFTCPGKNGWTPPLKQSGLIALSFSLLTFNALPRHTERVDLFLPCHEVATHLRSAPDDDPLLYNGNSQRVGDYRYEELGGR